MSKPDVSPPGRLPAALTAADADPAPQTPPHLAAALALLADLRPQDTSYQHRPTVVVWNGDGRGAAECRADCSTFVGAVLERAYGLPPGEIAALTGRNRPRARGFHDAIVAGNGFLRIESLRDALPGDLVAVAFSPDADATGHVMILAAPPCPRAPSPPLVAGALQWEADVVDATGTPHGRADSRAVGGGRGHTGAGRGPLRIYTDESGAVAGYTWSCSPKSVYRSQSQRHLVIGRYVPPPRP